MGGALVDGLVGAGWAAPEELAVVEVARGARDALASRHPRLEVRTDPHEVGTVADAVLAVKPSDAEGAARRVAATRPPRLLSIVAGVATPSLEAWLGPATAVVRGMPNTPALVGSGAAAISGGSRARQDDLDWAEAILGAVGTVVRVPEAMLDAVTAVSGSGPAYVFLVAEALMAAGRASGLPPDVSRALTVQTVLGSARLLAAEDGSAEELRAAVTSPGGTTAAAVAVLETWGIRAAFDEAVAAAVARSLELGAES